MKPTMFIFSVLFSVSVFASTQIELGSNECVHSIKSSSISEQDDFCSRTLKKELRYVQKDLATGTEEIKIFTASSGYKICNDSSTNSGIGAAGIFFDAVGSSIGDSLKRSSRRSDALERLDDEFSLNKEILNNNKCN